MSVTPAGGTKTGITIQGLYTAQCLLSKGPIPMKMPMPMQYLKEFFLKIVHDLWEKRNENATK